MKKDVLKNVTKFTGKHLRQILFFNKTLLGKELRDMFSCELKEIFKNIFFTEHLLATASIFLKLQFFFYVWSTSFEWFESDLWISCYQIRVKCILFEWWSYSVFVIFSTQISIRFGIFNATIKKMEWILFNNYRCMSMKPKLSITISKSDLFLLQILHWCFKFVNIISPRFCAIGHLKIILQGSI